MKKLILFTKKYIYWQLLVIMVVGPFLLFLMTNASVDETNGAEKTILDLIIHRNQYDFMQYSELAWQSLAEKQVSRYFEMFVPVLCALGVIRFSMSEKKTGYLYFERIRMSRHQMNLIAYVAASFLSAICILTAYLLFCMVIRFVFPSIMNYGLPDELLVAFCLPRALLNWFMYGLLCGGFVCVMTLFSHNFATCISLSVGILFVVSLFMDKFLSTWMVPGYYLHANTWVFHPFLFISLYVLGGTVYVLVARKRMQ